MQEIKKYDEIIKNEIKSNNEFKKNLKGLIKTTLDFNQEVISIGTILKHLIENQQNHLNKEAKFALKEEDKPYGERNLDLVINETLVYENKIVQNKDEINEFIEILETYSQADSILKKEMFKRIEELIEYFKKYEIDPKTFIINTQRKEVWEEIETNCKLSIKKVDIDYFIDTIKIIKLKHSSTIKELNEYNKKVDEFFYNLNNNKNNTDYPKLDINLEPLLLDTQNLIETIELKFDELPEHLQTEQKVEFKEFLPVIHEYYKDQVCALSGGVSYTALSISLKHLQKLIDDDEPLSIILKELPQLQNSMQHLYILHWIAESLLKEILDCFSFKCSLGRTIKQYKIKFPSTQTSFEQIQYAVRFRNNVAHKGYIWKPEEFEKSIVSYRRYVDVVSEEGKIDLGNFHLSVIDNKIDKEAKKNRFKKFMKKQNNQKLIIDEELLSDDMIEKGIEFLENYDWKPSDAKFKSFIYSLKRKLYEKFANEYFDGMSYDEVKKCLINYAIEKENPKDEEIQEIERQSLKDFYNCVYRNFNNKQIEKKVKEMKKKIQKSCGKKFFKGLMKWF